MSHRCLIDVWNILFSRPVLRYTEQVAKLAKNRELTTVVRTQSYSKITSFFGIDLESWNYLITSTIWILLVKLNIVYIPLNVTIRWFVSWTLLMVEIIFSPYLKYINKCTFLSIIYLLISYTFICMNLYYFFLFQLN